MSKRFPEPARNSIDLLPDFYARMVAKSVPKWIQIRLIIRSNTCAETIPKKKLPLAGPWDAKEDPRPDKKGKSAARAPPCGVVGFSTLQPLNSVNNGVK